MMHRYLAPLAFLLLAACAREFDPPLVDTAGHEATYARDQSDCIKQAQAAGWQVGQPVSDCMRNKGYKILQIRG